MMSQPDQQRSRWGNYWIFLLAAVGSSIGLGNLWRFPSELGVYGGTYLYIYLISLFFLGLPLLASELFLGRLGRANPVHSLKHIAIEERLSSLWQIIGWLGILTSFLIFSFYSVVAAWVLFYVMQSTVGSFTQVPAEIVQNSFGALLRNTDQMIIWHSVFILMVVVVLSRGVRQGLEKALKVLVPLVFLLLLWFVFFAREVGDFSAASAFMVTFNWDDLTPSLVVSAITQSLFSLSIGIGILIVFGTYADRERPLFFSAFAIVFGDTLIAIAMGLIIFSIVFAYGLDPASGTGLIFETLPVAFSQLDAANSWLGTLFFLLMLLAALSAGFALLEPTIALLMSVLVIDRRLAAWFAGFLAWCLGLVCIYGFSDLRFAFYYFERELHYGFFDFFNILSVHVFLPLTAFLIAIFCGWRLSSELISESFNASLKLNLALWRFCNRILAPVVLGLVLLIVLFYPA